MFVVEYLHIKRINKILDFQTVCIYNVAMKHNKNYRMMSYLVNLRSKM